MCRALTAVFTLELFLIQELSPFMSNVHTQALSDAGVSIWLDDLSRHRITSGSLESLMREVNVTGVTTNPVIFASALADSESYAADIAEQAAQNASVDDAVVAITSKDVAQAADLLRPIYDATDGVDGRVSIEVDPRHAFDTQATIDQAVALWESLNRPNVMIKIPATDEGLPAITECLARGISVNVTLIFGLQRYREVLSAFLRGLEKARDTGLDLASIHSVASFFISRLDTEVDARLDAIGSPEALALRGKAGLANARLAYEIFREVSLTQRWKTLAAQGAHPQRPLWASTGVKNPDYADTLYVDELVAAQTVTTLPEATLKAVADHGGDGKDTVSGTYREQDVILDELSELGIDYNEVIAKLETEGVQKFVAAWKDLLTRLEAELQAASER